jgi:hypothetical protein
MLSFAQPLFLLALGGLVLPVLIHRISRARPVPWKFPSISRIRQTPLPRHGSRSLTDLLLLLLRMLLLALLILALAGPVWQQQEPDAAATSAAETSSVIVFDFSSSMSGWGAINEAREILNELDLNSSDSLAWIAFSEFVVTEQAPDSVAASLGSLREFLKLNKPDTTAGNPEPALQRALALLGDSGNRRLILISDFQSTDWSATLPLIPEAIELELNRVGSQGRESNFAIHQVRTLPGDKDRIRILAEIMNFSSTEQSVTVELTIDEDKSSQKVPLKPGVRTPVAFEVEDPRSSRQAQLSLLSGNDPYPRDDQITFIPSAPPPLNVLALNPDGGLTGESEEIFFLDQALQIASSLEWIQFSLIPAGPDAINPDTLNRIAAVVIPSESASSKSVQWDKLQTYAEQGGLVLVTLGDDAVRAVQEMKMGGFPAGDYLGLAGRERFKRHYIGPIPDASRLARVFEGPAERDLYLMTIRQYSRLTPPADGTVLLQSESGDPLLLDIPIGKGHLVISTFPWNRMASDFPLRPSFLPIVREVMGLALDSNRNLYEADPVPAIPRSESVTTIIPDEPLIARLRGGRISSAAPAGSTTADRTGKAGFQLAPWLLLIAFIIWLLESFLAARLIKAQESERRPV